MIDFGGTKWFGNGDDFLVDVLTICHGVNYLLEIWLVHIWES